MTPKTSSFPKTALTRLPTSPLPPPPPTAPATSSTYLTPQQQDRILAWRSNASAAQSGPSPPGSAGMPPLSQSAPASLHASKSSGKSKPGRSYYAKKRNTNGAPPGSGSNGRSRSTATLANHNLQTSQGLIQTPSTSPTHVQGASTPQTPSVPPRQWGQTAPLPERVVAAPPAGVPSRIAGARDPISTNYWNQVFPPMVGQMTPVNPMIAAVVYPPQMYAPGMVMGRPWGF